MAAMLHHGADATSYTDWPFFATDRERDRTLPFVKMVDPPYPILLLLLSGMDPHIIDDKGETIHDHSFRLIYSLRKKSISEWATRNKRNAEIFAKCQALLGGK